MTGIQKAIICLNCLGSGLFAPALSLFFLEHGCDLRTLSAAIGVYSGVVILFEMPSGMVADLWGRKCAFFASAGFTFAAFAAMYFSCGLPMLMLGIVLFGVGTAFLSGSLDSLIIEDCVRRKGHSALGEVTSSMLRCQCIGIASGALISAVLPAGNGYLAHVALRLLILLVVALLSALFLWEQRDERCAPAAFSEQASAVLTSLKNRRSLRIVLLGIFGSSLSLFALEIYWQPRFTSILAGRNPSFPGILCAMGYAGNWMGSFLAGRMKLTGTLRRWRCYLLSTACLGCVAGALAFQETVIGFVLCYVAIMVLLGIANVPEQTILNAEASDDIRATMLSAASFSSKLSGVFCSVACAALIVPMKVGGVWLLMGGCTVLAVLIAAMRLCATRA